MKLPLQYPRERRKVNVAEQKKKDLLIKQAGLKMLLLGYALLAEKALNLYPYLQTGVKSYEKSGKNNGST